MATMVALSEFTDSSHGLVLGPDQGVFQNEAYDVIQSDVLEDFSFVSFYINECKYVQF